MENQANNEILSSNNVELCEQLTQHFTRAAQGILYWRRHRHHKCYNCGMYGHLAKDCDNICPMCGNWHNSKVCIRSLTKLYKKIYNKISSNILKDPEAIMKYIDETELKINEANAGVSIKTGYKIKECQPAEHFNFQIIRPSIQVKYTGLKPCVVRRDKIAGKSRRFSGLFRKHKTPAGIVHLSESKNNCEYKYLEIVSQPVFESTMRKYKELNPIEFPHKTFGGYIEMKNTGRKPIEKARGGCFLRFHAIKTDAMSEQNKKLRMLKTRYSRLLHELRIAKTQWQIIRENHITYDSLVSQIELMQNDIETSKAKLDKIKTNKNKIIGDLKKKAEASIRPKIQYLKELRRDTYNKRNALYSNYYSKMRNLKYLENTKQRAINKYRQKKDKLYDDIQFYREGYEYYDQQAHPEDYKNKKHAGARAGPCVDQNPKNSEKLICDPLTGSKVLFKVKGW